FTRQKKARAKQPVTSAHSMNALTMASKMMETRSERKRWSIPMLARLVPTDSAPINLPIIALPFFKSACPASAAIQQTDDDADTGRNRERCEGFSLHRACQILAEVLNAIPCPHRKFADSR